MTRPALVAALLVVGATAPAGGDDRPALRVDVPSPTKDKPQSKLWFAEGRWWAWLPTRAGSSVWERAADGTWHRHTSLDGPFAGLPGRADVWADRDGVRAVLVGKDRLAVVALRFDPAADTYRPAGKPVAWPTGPVETATIARDGAGRWWVAYTRDRRPWVRSSADGTDWGEPQPLGDPADADDICCAVALPGAVGVLWSDQKADAVWFRRHLDGKPSGEWEPVEAVARGGKTADDHLNAAVGPDGTLYVATKNSLDKVGRPQLVLRIRRPDGRWENLPYADRTAAGEPSRPIAVLGGGKLFLAHTVYGRGPKPRPDFIAGVVCDAARPDPTGTPFDLIVSGQRLNNVTSAKAAQPSGAGVPWVVLADDHQGNVYEGLLPR